MIKSDFKPLTRKEFKNLTSGLDYIDIVGFSCDAKTFVCTMFYKVNDVYYSSIFDWINKKQWNYYLENQMGKRIPYIG